MRLYSALYAHCRRTADTARGGVYGLIVICWRGKMLTCVVLAVDKWAPDTVSMLTILADAGMMHTVLHVRQLITI